MNSFSDDVEMLFIVPTDKEKIDELLTKDPNLKTSIKKTFINVIKKIINSNFGYILFLFLFIWDLKHLLEIDNPLEMLQG